VEEAEIIADKIRVALAETYHLNFEQNDIVKTVEHHCTSSIGVMLFFGTEMAPQEILRNADIAMYRAKENGRNTVRFYEEHAFYSSETPALS
jgi:diguanylate cyclase (GGDEF)-like protein